MFKNLTLGRKIYAGFAIVLVFTVAIEVIAVFRMIQCERAFSKRIHSFSQQPWQCCDSWGYCCKNSSEQYYRAYESDY